MVFFAQFLRLVMVGFLLVMTSLTTDSQPSLFAQLDQNKDGVVEVGELSESQKSSFRRAVRIADADLDGRLTAAELQAAVKPTHPVNMTPQRNRQFDISRLDRNRDGKLTKDEVPQALRSRLDQLFTIYGKEIPLSVLEGYRDRSQSSSDADMKSQPRSSGEATMDRKRSAFPQVRSGMQRRSNSQDNRSAEQSDQMRSGMVGGLLQRLDRNKDGKLSQSEVPSQAWNRLKRFDRNSDGVIERREFMNRR